MKKVKEMAVCMGKGKVCEKVQEAYSQLIEVLSGMEELEAYGQTETMAYEIAHTAMIAKKIELSKQIHKTCLGCEIKTAEKAVYYAYKNVFAAISIANEVNSTVLQSMMLENKNISIDEYSRCVKEAHEASEPYKLAEQELDTARESLNEAKKVLSSKQYLFSAMYAEM